jgi:hypothetical protein
VQILPGSRVRSPSAAAKAVPHRSLVVIGVVAVLGVGVALCPAGTAIAGAPGGARARGAARDVRSVGSQQASSRRRPSVYAIGDSVMIDAESRLHAHIRHLKVNAEVSRQTHTGVSIVARLKSRHRLSRTTVFGLGTNGTLTRHQIRRLERLTRHHKLVMITSHCPYCSWTHTNNKRIRKLCRPRHHCWVAAFQAHARRHPGWFVSDGVHMPIGGRGADAYARIVARTHRRAIG